MKEAKQRKSTYHSRSNYSEPATESPPLEQKDSKLYVRIADTSQADVLVALKNQLETSEGTTEVVLVMGSDKEKSNSFTSPHFDR